MKKLITFLCLLLWAIGASAQTSVTGIVNLYNTTPSTPGTQLTSTILNNGTVGAIASSWSTTGTAANLTVGVHSPLCALGTPLTTSTTPLPVSMLSQSISLNNATNFTYLTATLASNSNSLSFGACITFGGVPTTTNLMDMVRVNGVNGGYAALQLNSGSCINIESNPGGVTTHSGCITPAGNQPTYWCTMKVDPATTQTDSLACYLPTYPYTQVGSTVTAPTGTLGGYGAIFQIYLGNAEAGTASGHTTFFENFVVDQTNSAFPLGLGTQYDTWAGIVAPTRATDWSAPGVAGGIPTTYTQCGSTVAAGTSAATIQSLLAACANNTFLLLAPGTFAWTAGVQFNVGHRILRGSGSNQTLIVPTGSSGCGGESAVICLRAADGNWPGGPINTATFSGAGPWPRGTNKITLSSVTGLVVGNPLILDQVDDASGTQTLVTNPDTGNIYICDAGGNGSNGCSENGSGNQESDSQRGMGTNAVRDQQQFVTVTGIAGNIVTFTPALYMSNWRTSQSPGAWWSGNPVLNFGVENLSIDGTNAGANYNVEMVNCAGCWVTGVQSINPGRSHFTSQYSNRDSYRNNYLYGNTHTGTNCSGSQPCYGVELFGTSDTLVENNIVQKTSAPLMVNGSCSGCVIAYNFAINNIYTGSSTWDQQMTNSHSVTDDVLWEGNIGDGIYLDLFHGTGNFDTAFRNRLSGRSINNGTNATSHTNSFLVWPFHRYMNFLGNVMGTSGYHTTYLSIQGSSGSTQDLSVLVVGTGTVNCCLSGDSLVQSSLELWGNYDTVNAAVRFNTGEVPSAFTDTTGSSSLYTTFVPPTTLPASFYYSAEPSWWPATKAWPPIGPDVTGGNIANVGGHAYTNPAEDCYSNVMGGPANGVGSALSFNASNCYSASGGGAAVSLSPNTIPFSAQAVNSTSAAQTITLTNIGTATLNIASIALTGTNAANFGTLNSTCGATLGAGLNCTIQVTFSPLAVQSYSANLTFTTNAPSSPDNVTLTGTGALTGVVLGSGKIIGAGIVQ